MKNTTLKQMLALVVGFFITTSLFAQGLRYEVPLTEQVQSSTQIIEGKVISQNSFWDANRHNIYTINTIEVYKVFKGQTQETIEVITSGGTVGLDSETVAPSLNLSKEDIGIFMLHDNTVAFGSDVNSNTLKFKAFSASQGFYKYDISKNIAINPFNVKNGIIDVLYSEILNLTQTNIINVLEFDVLNAYTNRVSQRNFGAISISSISPTTITSGTTSELVITGSGFGATQGSGSVGFSNANNGGASYHTTLETQVKNWSDTEIIVEVPTAAGTGDIQVTNNNSDVGNSSQTLTVLYAELNAEYNPGSGEVAYMTQHINRDGSGGYIWQMQTDFDANTSANESFVRALDTWRCETDINWTIGSVTTTDVVANDNINIIRFDNGSELPGGVLGRCTTRWSGCGGAEIKWYVEELDIVFNDGTNWNFGPNAPGFTEYDFETVAVHELGHGHQLGHVIDTNAIMHYSVSNGESNRSLGSNDISGGGDVQSRSNTDQVCGQSLMDDFDCSTLSTIEETLEASILMYPNPAQNILNIKNISYIELTEANIYGVGGRLIVKIDMSTSNQLKKVDVSQFGAGVYFISIDSDKGSITKKFIIK